MGLGFKVGWVVLGKISGYTKLHTVIVGLDPTIHSSMLTAQ